MEILKKYVPLSVAVISGLAAVFLMNIYIQKQVKKTQADMINAQKSLVSVVVATKEISSGATIKENMIEVKTVNKNALQPYAADSIERVIGKIACVPFSQGEQILLNKVTISSESATLSHKVSRGKRAITIPVDNIASVGGMIRPGDYVDGVVIVPMPVQASEGKQVNQMVTLPLFQNVQVLAVGQDFTVIPSAKKEGKTPHSSFITLALNPPEANMVAFVQEQAKIRLILRSPEDVQLETPEPVTWPLVFKTIMRGRDEKPAQAEIPRFQRAIEIYHGQQRELKFLE